MQTMLQSGLDVLPVLTHRFPFDRFEEGFAAMRSGDCGKVILEIGEETAIEETKAEARA
jgi:threonine 3-dehydrogenase